MWILGLKGLKVSVNDFFVHALPKGVYNMDNSIESGH